MLWGIFGAVTMTMAVIIGLPYGAFGVALAYVILEYLRTPLLWLYVGRTGAIEAKHILRVASPFVVGAHVAVALLWFLQSRLPGGSVVTLIIATILSYLIVTAIASLFAAGRETLAEVRILASKMLIIRFGGTRT